MGNAIARRPEHLLDATSLGRKKLSEVGLRDEFSALVVDYEARHLAKISGVTPEGARKWLDGMACPNVASLFNLAQHLTSVRDWVALCCGIERAVQAKSYDVWIQGLYAIAAGNGPDAMQARNAIARLTSPATAPEAPARDTQTIDMFARRKRA